MLKDEIESSGIAPVCLSGSGSAMFYIADDKDEGKIEQNKLKLEKEGFRFVIIRNNTW